MNKVIFSLVVILTLILLMSNNNGENLTVVDENLNIKRSKSQKQPPSMQMYYCIEKYANKYKIPKKYAYGIAYKETGYRGPFHWKYNHKRVSSAGAVGPMQIMLSTARYLNNEDVSREKLMTDIDYNVMTSMKLMRHLYDLRGDWGIALGEYNTGQICVNGYARDILNINLNWNKCE